MSNISKELITKIRKKKFKKRITQKVNIYRYFNVNIYYQLESLMIDRYNFGKDGLISSIHKHTV